MMVQEVTVHVIAPAAELAKDPLPGAVTLHTLKDAVKAHSAGGVKLPKVRQQAGQEARFLPVGRGRTSHSSLNTPQLTC
jgi:hypothetical protein